MYGIYFSENCNKEMSVFPWVCVTKIRSMLQRFKVPITAEYSSNGISGTRRAQMAPKSSEPFWKGHTKYRRDPPHLLTQPFTAANRFLGQDCARAFSLSSILWMLHNHSFQVRNRGRNRNAFKMSNDNRPELQCHWWYRGEGWIQWETCGTIEENRFIKALLLKCLIRHEMQERKDRRREMYKKKSVPINTNWADGQLLIPFEGHFWPLHFSFSHSFVSVMVNVVMLGLQKGGLHSSSVVHFLPPYGCTVPRCRLVRQDHMARPAKQVVSSKTLPVSPVFMFSPKIQI